jgi:EAL domain-containing protein (putative c-di-GMP-specific phosphodiesterase class I)
MLHQLPMDTLKIDRAFVKQLGAAAPDDDTLVRTILLLARTLKLDVVAEGIETEAQYAYLRAMGCTYGQGYHIAHPLPEAEAVAMLLSSPA